MSAGEIIETGDPYKDEVQRQWNNDPCGSQHGEEAQPESLEWYQKIERHRHKEYAPWMHSVMEFDRHSGESVLEIGAGLGTDLSQFALNGSRCTDLDLSAVHLAHAERNFSLRGLSGCFMHGDGETLPFSDNEFDVVYSNGVIHHTPDTEGVISEIFRVLKPGGKAIIMVYAENSLHYWKNIVLYFGIRQSMFSQYSAGEIMSRTVERSSQGQRPLVKVYTAKRLRRMFANFENIELYKRQLVREELPAGLRWLPLSVLMRFVGWNLIVKARKPAL